MKEREILIQLVDAGSGAFAVEVKDGNIRFNLTEMAKPYGTDPKQWLRYDESKRYIESVALVLNHRTADLLTVKRGGLPHEQGTWANDYRIAIEFARWLDPMFSIRVNELVWKLLTGQAAVAEPIAGVWPLVRNGLVGYPRREIMKAAGYSPKSGSIQRIRQLHPDHHYVIGGIMCISPDLAQNRIIMGKMRQMNTAWRKFGALPSDADLEFISEASEKAALSQNQLFTH